MFHWSSAPPESLKTTGMLLYPVKNVDFLRKRHTISLMHSILFDCFYILFLSNCDGSYNSVCMCDFICFYFFCHRLYEIKLQV